MPGVFLSYRRDDSSGQAGRLFDILAAHFGRDRVFMDLDTIRGGDNFVTVIEQQVARCDVLLAIIGERWLTVTSRTGLRRLDDPDDFVRLEIAKALERNVRVIPVLVGNASVPAEQDLPPDLRPLALRHAMDLRDAHFHEDAQKLIDILSTVIPATPAPKPKPPVAAIAAAGAVLVLAIVGGILFLHRGQSAAISSAPPTTSQATAPSINNTPDVESATTSAAPKETPSPQPAATGGLLHRTAPPAETVSLAGDWTGVVTYDWQNAVYPETFHFEGDGTDLSGTATLFTAPHAIRDFHVNGNRISFNIQSGTETPEGKIYTDTHNYKGVVTGTTIQFSMLTDSQVDTHDIIHFTVTRKLKK